MTASPRSGRRQAAIGFAALVLAASLLTVWRTVVSPAVDESPTIPRHAPLPQATVVPPGLSRTEFYRKDLLPLIDKAREQNLAAADRAADRLHQEFDRFRAGVPEFVDDV